MPVTTISDMVTFNQCLHENTNYHQLIKALLCCISFLFFLQMMTHDSKSHNQEPKIDL